MPGVTSSTVKLLDTETDRGRLRVYSDRAAAVVTIDSPDGMLELRSFSEVRAVRRALKSAQRQLNG